MMDSISVMYSVAFLLPLILLSGLCMLCCKKIPSHIMEAEYEYKTSCTPPSKSFMIVNRPLVPPRTASSQASMCPQDILLTIPRSPGPESRRSSVGTEIKGQPDVCDSIPYAASAPLLKAKTVEDDDYDDGADPNYTNDNPYSGYIQVLPEVEPAKHVPVLVVTCDVDSRASLSSVGTDENYVNVGDSDDAKASSVDSNYVNVGDTNDTKRESVEYVNVEDETQPSSINQESEDDDMPEYENVEKEHKDDAK